MEKDRDNNDEFLFYERVIAHINTDSVALNCVRGEAARSFKCVFNRVDEFSGKEEEISEGSVKPFNQVFDEVLRTKKA